MNYEAPPFFKRGPAPLALLCFYAGLSLALIFVDARFQTLELLRIGVSLLTHPLQQLALVPASLYANAKSHLSDLTQVQEENLQLKRAQLENSAQLLFARQLVVENKRLRGLLEMKPREKANGKVARILYAARDPFSRKLVVDKGQQDKIKPGQAAIDYDGVIGQVTRIFPFMSEITLITDKNHAIPVQILRNGLRSVLFGLGNGQLELRFIPANADIQNGDQLVTSGLDGIFPVGLPVAQVVRIERDTSYSFARIYCDPLAGVENFNELMILEPKEDVALPPELLVTKATKPTSKTKRKRTVME